MTPGGLRQTLFNGVSDWRPFAVDPNRYGLDTPGMSSTASCAERQEILDFLKAKPVVRSEAVFRGLAGSACFIAQPFA